MTQLRWVFRAIAAVSAVLALRFAFEFPWAGTMAALRSADWVLLALAAVTNLASLGAKGWAWHLLLRPAWPHRWRVAQAGTFIGAAVSVVSISVSGEAARLQALATRGEPPLAPAISSIVWSRVTEAIALALFLTGVLVLLPPAPWVRAARLGAVAVLAAVVLPWATGGSGWVIARLPAGWRSAVTVGSAGAPPLVAPVLLGTVNWMLQWLAYHWTIAATGITAPAGAALTALVAANLGGVLRLTPGNVGVLQAAVVMGLLPFGVAAERGLAGGLALQAVQVVPTLAVGTALVGFAGLRSLGARSARADGPR
ncbi:MAG TPA: lysylphosphatidylglycerol synthase transmembrane domain-containing protein [Gemmatimonadales bacterium]|nr:lysylphosphatidylglycerol synthase transmembrane domain-containing protein [Gemmatimonadales bacterium]